SKATRLDEAVVETATAVRRALGADAPDLAIAFVSPHHAERYDALPGLVRAALGPRTLVGCSAGGVIGGGHAVEEAPGAALPPAAVRPAVTTTPSPPPEPLPPSVPSDPPPGFVVCPEPFSFDAEEFVHAVDRAHPGSTIVGGVASGARQPGQNALFLDDAVHR